MGCLGKGTQEGKERGQGGSGSNKHGKIESKMAKKHQMHVNSCETYACLSKPCARLLGCVLPQVLKLHF